MHILFLKCHLDLCVLNCNLAITSFTVKIYNHLSRGFKFTYSYEDFEMKKLLFNIVAVLAKDLCAVQVSHN